MESLATSQPQENNVIKEEINLQFHWYMLAFFIIFLGSFLIPAIIFMIYIMLFYLPYFLETSNIVNMFTNMEPLLASIFIPFIIIICYLIHLFIVGVITRRIWRLTEKKIPTKSGIIPRNIPSKTLNYYHIRSFLIKYPKNAFLRGPFPWLINWLYNFVGTNKIGKGTTIEEQIGADKFVIIGDNSYIGTNGAISSHAVEGIFGNISYFEIKIGNNVTASAFNCIAPGVEIEDNTTLLPMSGATKFNILKNNSYYFGAPLRRIFKKRLMNYLQISEEDLQRAENLYEKLNKEKISQDKSEKS